MKCLRIKFILPPHLPLTFEKGSRVVLSLPEGDIELMVSINKYDIYTSYTFKSQQLENEIDESTIARIENALFLTFDNFDIGILLNPNLASCEITETRKALVGKNVESDFIGGQDSRL